MNQQLHHIRNEKKDTQVRHNMRLLHVQLPTIDLCIHKSVTFSTTTQHFTISTMKFILNLKNLGENDVLLIVVINIARPSQPKNIYFSFLVSLGPHGEVYQKMARVKGKRGSLLPI